MKFNSKPPQLPFHDFSPLVWNVLDILLGNLHHNQVQLCP